MLLASVGQTASSQPACINPSPQQGEMRVNCWSQSQPLSLAGEWQLHYQSQDNQEHYQGPMAVPGLWRTRRTPLPGMGEGQYRLILHFPQTVSGAALQLPWMSAARRAFITIDGQRTPLLDVGYRQRRAAQADYRHPLLQLPPLSGRVLLEVDVYSNFSLNGGMYGPPVLGDYQLLLRQHQKQKTLATALGTLIFMFALVNLVFWGLRDYGRGFLLLAALGTDISLRILINDSDVLEDFLPRFSVAADTYFGWVLFLGGAALGAAYFRTIYPRIIPRWLCIAAVLFSLIGLTLLFTSPIPVVQSYGEFYRPMVALLALALTLMLVRGYLRGQREVLYSLLSGMVVLVSFMFETLYFHFQARATPFLAYGLGWLVFLMIETWQMSRRFRRSMERAERLSSRNQMLEDIALRDPLTELGNRRAFDQRFEQEVKRHRLRYPGSQGPLLGLALIDLDLFKRINDEHGHDVGDQALQAVAAVLRERVRDEDFAARVGGEEFCLLMPDCGRDSARQTAERLRRYIETLALGSAKGPLSISASIGVAVLLPNMSRHDLLRNADRALYRAKDSGRNRSVCYWEMETEPDRDKEPSA
jgi:diguanylate cyclase (GGDEF)-like protein